MIFRGESTVKAAFRIMFYSVIHDSSVDPSLLVLISIMKYINNLEHGLILRQHPFAHALLTKYWGDSSATMMYSIVRDRRNEAKH